MRQTEDESGSSVRRCRGLGEGITRCRLVDSRPVAPSTRAPPRLGGRALRLAAVSCGGLDRSPSAGDAPGRGDCAATGFEVRLLAA